MAGKEWHPGAFKVGMNFLPWVEGEIDGAVDEQRALTGYEGPDEDWHSHVANEVWDAVTYQSIGYWGGYLRALLNVSYAGGASGVKLPLGLERKAYLYIYD